MKKIKEAANNLSSIGMAAFLAYMAYNQSGWHAALFGWLAYILLMVRGNIVWRIQHPHPSDN